MGNLTEKSITAEDNFTNWFDLKSGDNFDLMIAGTFAATISVQTREDEKDTDVITAPTTYTAPQIVVSEEVNQPRQIRVGVETGNFQSGSVKIKIARRAN